jgi:1,4-alpha-glucan branching enzyme
MLAALLSACVLLGLAACAGPAGPGPEKEASMKPASTQPQQIQRTPVPEWSENAVMYEVNIRQYTKEGSFRAFESHLPRLKELGVDVLWLMPIHPISKTKRNGTLGSYYAVADYKAVNPEFGTEDDFRSLVGHAHRLGMKVMLDWVANHTGWDNVWMAHPEWYTRDEAGNIVSPPGTDWKDVADLNYDNADLQAAMLDAMTYWVREFDIDGYRADYAGGVPTAFWEKARQELERIKPVYMLAEDDQHPDLLNRAFNANYGWSLYQRFNQLAQDHGNPASILAYGERLAKQYPAGTYPLHFIDNHDENAWTGTVSERLGDASRAMAALTFTMPGMPLLYSGQEAGLDKRLKFFDKDEIDWSDLSLQPFYQDLIRLKHDNPALWNGTAGGAFRGLDAGGGKVIAFERAKDASKVVVVANLSAERASGVVVKGAETGNYASYPSGAAEELGASFSVDLEPWEYRIYVSGGK